MQMTHVEPAVGDCSDKTSFDAHTNLRRFIYECNDVDKTVPADAPTLARQALKKIYLTSKFEAAFLQTKMSVFFLLLFLFVFAMLI